MNIIGLYGAYEWDGNIQHHPNIIPRQRTYMHDAGATIFKDGKHVCSILEERLSRIKYDGNFPTHSIEYCLDYSGLTSEQIDIVCVPSSPLLIWNEQLELNIIHSILYKKFPNARVMVISHHLSHAAASVVSSPYDEGCIAILDGAGTIVTNEFGVQQSKECNSVGYFNKKDKLIKLFVGDQEWNNFGDYYDRYCFPIYFEKKNIPDNERHLTQMQSVAGKIMGLCAYGKPEPNKKYIKSPEYWGGVPYIIWSPNDQYNGIPEDKAATLQATFESGMLDYMTMLKHRDYVYDNVCFGGGVFMNVLANSVIKNSGLFENTHMPPFPSDSGHSFGSAAYAAFMVEPEIILPKNLALLGREYTESQITSALDSFSLKYQRYDYDKIYSETAHLIDEDNIIGWFQGRSEAGARALGGRSILMSARNADNKDILNSRVKHREYWRPFAGVILEEHLHEYFENGFVSPYMMYSMTVTEDKRNIIPAITHIDNTCRIQTVTEDYNLHLSKMIQEYNKITGIPVVLNTSFNDNGEPIVETPEHAIKAFLSMDINYLVIGNYIVNKKDIK
jgi:carbamoyltransferase